jgi:hypothetical protein
VAKRRKGSKRSKLIRLGGHLYRLELVTRPKVSEVERRRRRKKGGRRR